VRTILNLINLCSIDNISMLFWDEKCCSTNWSHNKNSVWKISIIIMYNVSLSAINDNIHNGLFPKAPAFVKLPTQTYLKSTGEPPIITHNFYLFRNLEATILHENSDMCFTTTFRKYNTIFWMESQCNFLITWKCGVNIYRRTACIQLSSSYESTHMLTEK